MSQVNKKYLRDQILNATPDELIILLYDGAVKSLEDSRLHIHSSDPFEFNRLIVKAQNIIAELMGALKKKTQPDLVSNLAKLYEFIYQNLVDANLEKDEKKISEIIPLLRDLRGSWSQAIEKAKLEAPTKPDESTQEKRPALSFQA